MKQTLLLLITLMLSANCFAINYKANSRALSKAGNKSLHIYNGEIEIVEDGFVVTFFYTGNYRLTITDENGVVIYSAEVSATAGQPIYINSNGVSPEEDTINEIF